jgi:hypothetical protein
LHPEWPARTAKVGQKMEFVIYGLMWCTLN